MKGAESVLNPMREDDDLEGDYVIDKKLITVEKWPIISVQQAGQAVQQGVLQHLRHHHFDGVQQQQQFYVQASSTHRCGTTVSTVHATTLRRRAAHYCQELQPQPTQLTRRTDVVQPPKRKGNRTCKQVFENVQCLKSRQ
uniref:Uncharacterized protein n=1 Tax=Globodera pallida TaxID=36090 RepID=A0A183BNR7_GLOPA